MARTYLATVDSVKIVLTVIVSFSVVWTSPGVQLPVYENARGRGRSYSKSTTAARLHPLPPMSPKVILTAPIFPGYSMVLLLR